jgi:hypothetical protein
LDMILRAQESSVHLCVVNETSSYRKNVSSTCASSNVSLSQPLVPAPNISGMSANSNQPLLPQPVSARSVQNSPPIQLAPDSPVQVTRNSPVRQTRLAPRSNRPKGNTSAMIHAPPRHANIRPHSSGARNWKGNPMFHSTRDSGLEVSNPLFGQNAALV